jgi:uncharacterized membrane protein YwaF
MEKIQLIYINFNTEHFNFLIYYAIIILIKKTKEKIWDYSKEQTGIVDLLTNKLVHLVTQLLLIKMIN